MTTRGYITGFILSLAVTCASFGAVWLHYYTHHQLPTHQALAYLILAFAIIQLVLQLKYFLHMGNDTKSREWLTFTLATFLILFIVIGSIWIMQNLMQNHGVPFNQTISPQTSTD